MNGEKGPEKRIEQKEKLPQKFFEYKTLDLTEQSIFSDEHRLNRLGINGWEVAARITGREEDDNKDIVILKREISKEEAETIRKELEEREKEVDEKFTPRKTE